MEYNLYIKKEYFVKGADCMWIPLMAYTSTSIQDQPPPTSHNLPINRMQDLPLELHNTIASFLSTCDQNMLATTSLEIFKKTNLDKTVLVLPRLLAGQESWGSFLKRNTLNLFTAKKNRPPIVILQNLLDRYANLTKAMLANGDLIFEIHSKNIVLSINPLFVSFIPSRMNMNPCIQMVILKGNVTVKDIQMLEQLAKDKQLGNKALLIIENIIDVPVFNALHHSPHLKPLILCLKLGCLSHHNIMCLLDIDRLTDYNVRDLVDFINLDFLGFPDCSFSGDMLKRYISRLKLIAGK